MALCRTRISTPAKITGRLFCSEIDKKAKYKKCYDLLGVSQDSDQEKIRRAYLELVKQYHPDNPGGDLKKFQDIDAAFKVLIKKKSRERWDVEDSYEMEAEEFDIKHTAPQHRQYLSYGGTGSGTPFQREKQHMKTRAVRAADNVLQHRIAKITAEEKALMDKNVPFKHKIKTRYGFDRLVEDLIQESMSKGEFNNLSGRGKPLKQHQDTNPYVDFVTHKINQVLIENGFTPEWIALQKEIREETSTLRAGLSNERKYFGPHPFTNPEDADDWNDIVRKYKILLDGINKKIDKYNLVVPVLNKQMVQLDLNREASKILTDGESGRNRRINERLIDGNNNDTGNIFGFLSGIFKK